MQYREHTEQELKELKDQLNYVLDKEECVAKLRIINNNGVERTYDVKLLRQLMPELAKE
jgi:hypothetical protein